MKFLVVALLMTVISFGCFAQDSAEYRACSDKANTQSEMTACASDEAARVDAKLKTTYRALLARVTSQPEALAKIKAAERAWIAYRDAYIEATYPAEEKPPNTALHLSSRRESPSSQAHAAPRRRPRRYAFALHTQIVFQSRVLQSSSRSEIRTANR